MLSLFTSLSLAAACADTDSGTPMGDDDTDGDDDTGGASEWEGKTYLLTIPDANFSDPRGVGDDIGPYVPQFLMEVTSVDGNDVELVIGAAIDDQQDMCTPTTTATGEADYPDIEIGPVDFPMHIEHENQPVAVDTTIYDMTFKNLLPEDGEVPRDGEFVGTMDFREVAPMLTLANPRTPERVCDLLLDQLGAECQGCSDDDPFCLTLTAILLGAEESDLELERISADEVGEDCAPYDDYDDGSDAGAP